MWGDAPAEDIVCPKCGRKMPGRYDVKKLSPLGQRAPQRGVKQLMRIYARRNAARHIDKCEGGEG